MGFFFHQKVGKKTLPLTGGSQPNQAAIQTVDKRCVRSCSEATIHTGSYNLSILVAGREHGVNSVFLFFLFFSGDLQTVAELFVLSTLFGKGRCTSSHANIARLMHCAPL